MDSLADLASERSILSTIVKNGKDALLDATSVLEPDDFYLKLNKDIFTCLVSLEEEDLEEFDIESIKLKINAFGFEYILKNKEYVQYLDMLFEGFYDTKNLSMFVYQVKKYSITRGLYKNYSNAIGYLESLEGNEKLSEIISNAETQVTKYVGQDEGSDITNFSEGIDEYVEKMIEAESVDQVGLPTGLNRYDEAIGGGLRPGTVNVVGARPKCVNSEKTFVPTSRGFLSMEELHQENTNDCDYEVINNEGRFVKPSWWKNFGKSKTIKFVTKYGFEIEVTPDHPLYVLNKKGDFEWVEAQFIKKEDVLVLRRGDNLWGSGSIDLDDAYFWGVMCGDGHSTVNSTGITTEDAEIKRCVYKYAKKYNFRIFVNKKKDNKASSYLFRGQEKCVRLGLFDPNKIYKDGQKVIPKFIRHCNKEVICSFLRGYFDTDGCAEKSGTLSCSTKSETLSQQIHSCLMNLGILSSRRIKFNKKYNKNYYHIEIRSVQNIIKFKELIGFNIKRKNSILIDITKRVSSPKCDTVPNLSSKIKSLVNIKKENQGYAFAGHKNLDRDQFSRWSRSERSIERNSFIKKLDVNFSKYKETKEYCDVIEKINSNIFYDRVISIDQGECVVSDFRIPDGRSFVANSFVSSNCGKSFLSMNVAINVAKQGVPVLYLDTELTQEYQRNRLICIESGCPLYDFERSKFKNNEQLVEAVRLSKGKISGMPFYHKEVGGMEYAEIINVARRWITKEVGFDQNGHANPCLIVYDYLKLTGMSSLGSNIPEHIALGFMLTELHNFAVKFNVPIFALVQLNRDGIDDEDSAVIAGSDRILWLCSSFTILKNKTENDVSLGCGYEHGNKKLIVVETRQGSGLEVPGDYINLKCSLRPNISKDEACGKIVEGNFASIISGGYAKTKQPNSDNTQNSQQQNPSSS